MTKIKVKINQEAPSLETVHSYRDFGSIMQSYQKYYTTSGIRHLLYKDRKKLVYIVIILIFLLLLLFAEEVEASTLLLNLK